GVPGLATTSLVETLGTVLGLQNKRIQFTPDLMPSDIVGSEVLEEETGGRRSFRFVKGPIFTQLLMADEINRASPKTQSALLQAMQEHHVTVAGVRHDVPRPFHVLATQNPLEQEGTYPLPEAQLDRFLLQIDVSYPDVAAERRMLFATTGVEDRVLKTILSADELMMAQRLVRQLPVGDQVVDAILNPLGSAWNRHRPGARRYDCLGPGSPRESGADACRAGKGADRGPACAFHRRCDRSRRARAQAPHGAHLRRSLGEGRDERRGGETRRAARVIISLGRRAGESFSAIS